MAAKVTLERILRDDDDSTGQDIREWKIEREGSRLKIRDCRGSGFLLIRASDADELMADIKAMASGHLNAVT